MATNISADLAGMPMLINFMLVCKYDGELGVKGKRIDFTT